MSIVSVFLVVDVVVSGDEVEVSRECVWMRTSSFLFINLECENAIMMSLQVPLVENPV